jgi:hypothetical protein
VVAGAAAGVNLTAGRWPQKYSSQSDIDGTVAEAGMARHNREAIGTDQRGIEYRISYQPDWLRLIKVTRTLESGRQSTKTLLRNAAGPEHNPGRRIRTAVAAAEQDLVFEIAVDDPRRVVRRVIVETVIPGEPAGEGLVVFTLEDHPPGL